jgi:hypothetical protein
MSVRITVGSGASIASALGSWPLLVTSGSFSASANWVEMSRPTTESLRPSSKTVCEIVP